MTLDILVFHKNKSKPFFNLAVVLASITPRGNELQVTLTLGGKIFPSVDFDVLFFLLCFAVDPFVLEVYEGGEKPTIVLPYKLLLYAFFHTVFLALVSLPDKSALTFQLSLQGGLHWAAHR